MRPVSGRRVGVRVRWAVGILQGKPPQCEGCRLGAHSRRVAVLVRQFRCGDRCRMVPVACGVVLAIRPAVDVASHHDGRERIVD